MSKLQERLERVASGPSRPLGFSFGNRESLPPLVIVTRVTSGTAKAVETATKAGSEFILVDGAAAAKSAPKTGDTPWGARVDGLTEKELGALREAGCDFLFVSLGDTPVRLLNDESLGYFGVVPADLDERRLRAIERLPFEGNVVEAEAGDSLTVGLALEYAAAASRLSGYLLAPGVFVLGRRRDGTVARYGLRRRGHRGHRRATGGQDRRSAGGHYGRAIAIAPDVEGAHRPGFRRWWIAQPLHHLMTAMMTMTISTMSK